MNEEIFEELDLTEEKTEENKIEAEKYLPLGSVVLLKNGKKRLMITGYLPVDMESKDRIFDYCGCVYPIGVIRTDQVLMFNHENIVEISAIGYQDEEQKEFLAKLKETVTEDAKKEILEKIKASTKE